VTYAVAEFRARLSPGIIKPRDYPSVTLGKILNFILRAKLLQDYGGTGDDFQEIADYPGAMVFLAQSLLIMSRVKVS
jgi:hypothetical protein